MQMSHLHSRLSMINHLSPLLIASDFNATLGSHERALSSETIKDISFESFIFDNGLIDLPLSESKFTWSNVTHYSCIDRFLLNDAWLSMCHSPSKSSLPRGLSNHTPITL